MRSCARRLVAVLVLLVLPSGTAQAARRSRKSRPIVRVRILHTNDIHGYISGRHTDAGRTGGLPLLAGVLNQERYRARKRGEVSLYLDAGDLFKGTPVVDASAGRCMIDILNRMHLDALALGNHEFDYGVESLDTVLDEARFPILAANLERPGDLLQEIEPHVLFDRKGIRIGVMGLIAQNTPLVTSATEFHGATFTDPVDAARREVEVLREAGADVILALTHLGLKDDLALVGRVDGIDGVIGGHTHTLLDRPIIRSTPSGTRAFVVQAGAYAQHLGWVSFSFDRRSKRVFGVRGGVTPITAEDREPNRKIAQIVDEYEAPIREFMQEEVGELEAALPVGRRGMSSPVGEMIAAALRAETRSDLAFINYGGFRRPLPAGRIIREDLHTLMPFGNKLVKLVMYGKDIRAMLDRMIGGDWEPGLIEPLPGSTEPREVLLPAMSELGFLVGSGISATFDPRVPARKRRCTIEVGDAPLNDEDLYSVVVADFLARGGDGFTEFTRARRRRELTTVGRDAVEAYLEKTSPVGPPARRSIINLSAEPPPPPEETPAPPRGASKRSGGPITESPIRREMLRSNRRERKRENPDDAR